MPYLSASEVVFQEEALYQVYVRTDGPTDMVKTRRAIKALTARGSCGRSYLPFCPASSVAMLPIGRYNHQFAFLIEFRTKRILSRLKMFFSR